MKEMVKPKDSSNVGTISLSLLQTRAEARIYESVQAIINEDIRFDFRDVEDDEQYREKIIELNQQLEEMQQEISATLYTELQKYKLEVEDWILNNYDNPDVLKKATSQY
jgi:hypothetical protein